MKLSVELLLSNLAEGEPELQGRYKVASRAGAELSEIKISRIRFLTSPELLADKETLWFADADMLRGIEEDLSGSCVVGCIDGRGAEELGNCGCICICADDTICLMRIFNSFVHFFKIVSDWEKDTDLIIAHKESLQKLLERAEGILGNPVFMWDGSFNIIGRPTKPVPELPLWEKWLELGYIPGDGVMEFAKLGYFNNSYEHSDLHLLQPRIFDYPFVLRVYSEGLRESIVLAQYFTNKPYTPARLELFKLLEEKIERYAIEIMRTGKREKNLIYEPFISDIIQGYYTEEEIKDKLKYIKLPYEAKYRVYAVAFERYSKPLAVYVRRAFKQLVPTGHAIELNHHVYMLSRDASKDQRDEEEFMGKVLEILESSACFCGVSNEVSNLYGIKAAAAQARAAIKMGVIMQSDRRCWQYRDMYAYNVISCFHREMDMDDNSLIFPGLEEFIKGDEENSNDNLKLLDIFLNKDRNITNTAKEMFLHRNTVIYRIGKIEQMLGASLDDPQVRFDLLMSLKFIELRTKMRQLNDNLKKE